MGLALPARAFASTRAPADTAAGSAGDPVPFFDDVAPADTSTAFVPPTLLGRWRVGADPAAVPSFSAADFRIAQRVVLRALSGSLPVDTAVTVCVSVRQNNAPAPADANILADIASPTRTAVAPANCPRTYAGIQQADAAGRPVIAPPGWIDPYRFDVTKVQAWTPSIVFVQAEVAHGTSVQQFRCGVTRTGSHWHADCLSNPDAER